MERSGISTPDLRRCYEIKPCLIGEPSVYSQAHASTGSTCQYKTRIPVRLTSPPSPPPPQIIVKLIYWIRRF